MKYLFHYLSESAMENPKIIALAGPNGAGKSTVAPVLLRALFGVVPFVNADVIARGLSAYSPESVALAAGRIMLKRMREMTLSRRSFAFETTLSARSYAPWIRRLKEQGYSFHLLFLWLENAELAMQRVQRRIEAGGHAIPEDAILRRYRKGLENFHDLYCPIATSWGIYNNSQNKIEAIAFGKGREISFLQNPPLWQKVRRQE
jgi:predicted ABC-type ATPase